MLLTVSKNDISLHVQLSDNATAKIILNFDDRTNRDICHTYVTDPYVKD